MSAKENKVFFPNLDGLRFICFIAVFLFHSFATNVPVIKEDGLYHVVKGFLVANGNLGVNFFFVLSGFLITFLLFSEKGKHQRISIPNFYVRRVLRIWPLFYCCVFFGFVIFPVIKQAFGEAPQETAHSLYYLFFLNNLDFIKNGLPDSSVLGILWSVAVEEQFYLVWPVLIAFTPRNRVPLLFLLIIVLTFLFRLGNYANEVILEHHTFSCISDMAVGGFAAYGAFYNKWFLEKIRTTRKVWWLLLYASIAMIFLFRRQFFDGSSYLVASDRLLISILFALVILEQNYANHSLIKMARFRSLSKLGVYTYGLYCLHMIGILIAARGLGLLGLNKTVYGVLFLEGGLSLLITIGLGYVSYHLFEKRFLKLKERFALVKTITTENNNLGSLRKLSMKSIGLITRKKV